ncbi:MAG: hypothetical protein ACD_10C00827G0003 [uncultured bacterium]|nr:MAG: hypothetical protein ACD_10C00827G0003 [uncultured bacterium]
MANNIVRLTDQFSFAEAADIDEILIDIGNPTFKVCFRDNQGVVIERDFHLAYRQIISHKDSSVR